MHLRPLFALVFVCLTLLGGLACGQKGSLYLPEQPPEKESR